MDRMMPLLDFESRNKYGLKLPVALHSGNVQNVNRILQTNTVAQWPALN